MLSPARLMALDPPEMVPLPGRLHCFSRRNPRKEPPAVGVLREPWRQLWRRAEALGAAMSRPHFAPFRTMDWTVRAVMVRAPARNENLAILTINPMPEEQVSFDNIKEVIEDFLVDHLRVSVREIQPCCLGQAFVRFEFVHDRDSLVNASPHPFGGVEFTLVKHNRGTNWAGLNFNRECWLMLMGFPIDFWDQASIENAISFFGRLLSWEEDYNNLSRLLLRARVTDLHKVPEFIVLTVGEGFQGESWTIQCEIIQEEMLGGGPPDEQPFPGHGGGPNPPFHYMGFGQAAPGFHAQQNMHNENQGPNWGQLHDGNQQNDNQQELPTEPDVIQQLLNAEPIKDFGNLHQLNGLEMNEEAESINLSQHSDISDMSVNQNNDLAEELEEAVAIQQINHDLVLALEAHNANNEPPVFLPMEIQEEELMGINELQQAFMKQEHQPQNQMQNMQEEVQQAQPQNPPQVPPEEDVQENQFQHIQAGIIQLIEPQVDPVFEAYTHYDVSQLTWRS
ncbi:hypothetical protein EJB05_00666, partial [Eragrostis curvula]